MGSAATMMAAIELATREAQLLYEELSLDDVPVPNLQTADPLVALEELFAFDRWVTEFYPGTSWVPVISVEASQAAGLYNRFWSSLVFNLRVRWDGYTEGHVLDAALTPLQELGFPDAVVNDAPDGAIGIAYASQGPGYAVTDLDTGEVKGSVEAWTSSGRVILVPTEAGWRLWQAEADA